jgi:hypothetical protein
MAYLQNSVSHGLYYEGQPQSSNSQNNGVEHGRQRAGSDVLNGLFSTVSLGLSQGHGLDNSTAGTSQAASAYQNNVLSPQSSAANSLPSNSQQMANSYYSGSQYVANGAGSGSATPQQTSQQSPQRSSSQYNTPHSTSSSTFNNMNNSISSSNYQQPGYHTSSNGTPMATAYSSTYASQQGNQLPQGSSNGIYFLVDTAI